MLHSYTGLATAHKINDEVRWFKNPNETAFRFAKEQPVQCFSPTRLLQQYELFNTKFHGRVSYAVKANPSAHIIANLAKNGLRLFDVASINEMELINLLVENPVFNYHNPIRTLQETQTAYYKFGCRRFAIDEQEKLNQLVKVAGNDERLEVAVRFKLPKSNKSVHDFSEKFGADPHKAARLIKQIQTRGYQPVLTFHPGSQCLDPTAWQEHIFAAADIAASTNTTPKYLNIGGGFPIDYAASPVLPLEHFFKEIEIATKKGFPGSTMPRLECEPGRALVGPTSSLLTRVKMIRRACNEIYINDGIYGSLMEAYQAKDLQAQVSVISNSKARPANKASFTVYGPTCDPLDKLPNQINLPGNIEEGDFLLFKNLGAYSNATATNFNGYGYTDLVYVENQV